MIYIWCEDSLCSDKLVKLAANGGVVHAIRIINKNSLIEFLHENTQVQHVADVFILTEDLSWKTNCQPMFI